MLRLIGNLSNTSNYSYTDRDVAKIFDALNEEWKGARQRFLKARTPKKVGFTLGE